MTAANPLIIFVWVPVNASKSAVSFSCIVKEGGVVSKGVIYETNNVSTKTPLWWVGNILEFFINTPVQDIVEGYGLEG